MGMKIRKAQRNDLPELLNIYHKAREFMKQNGNSDQWGEAYPSVEILEKDLQDGNLYLCMDEDGIEGVFVFFVGEEPTYQNIVNGGWLNDRPYGTIHRIASAGKKTGIGTFCVDWCYQQYQNLRGDTHLCNLPMQRVFEKNGFTFCGTIHLPDGSSRIAYQKSE